MLGIAFLLDFVTSFCREYGAAWIWPKNGTRTAELVQQRQRRRAWRVRGAGRKFSAFFGRDPCIYSAPNTTALCSRYVHLTLECCAVLRSICCIMQLVLLWCYSLQWHWQWWIASAFTKQSSSLPIFITISTFFATFAVSIIFHNFDHLHFASSSFFMLWGSLSLCEQPLTSIVDTCVSF